MNNRLLLIYNPKAGKGMFLEHLADVIDMFTKAGFAVEAYPTQARGDATAKIRHLEGDYNLIVPAGGDGTLDEVVTGMIRSGRTTPIGYLPVGSTNDYATSLGLSSNIMEAVGDIISGEPRSVDVGLFNQNHVFVYVAAFGAFTDVAYETNQDMKNALGHFAYILEGVKRLGDLKPYTIRVTTPEFETQQEYIFGMVTNSISVGGFRNLTGESVKLNDGVFEVTMVRNPKNILEMQEIIGSIMTGSRDTDLIDYFRTGTIELNSLTDISWTLDGEYGGTHKDVVIADRQKGMQIVLDRHGRTDVLE